MEAATGVAATEAVAAGAAAMDAEAASESVGAGAEDPGTGIAAKFGW